MTGGAGGELHHGEVVPLKPLRIAGGLDIPDNHPHAQLVLQRRCCPLQQGGLTRSWGTHEVDYQVSMFVEGFPVDGSDPVIGFHDVGHYTDFYLHYPQPSTASLLNQSKPDVGFYS